MGDQVGDGRGSPCRWRQLEVCIRVLLQELGRHSALLRLALAILLGCHRLRLDLTVVLNGVVHERRLSIAGRQR